MRKKVTQNGKRGASWTEGQREKRKDKNDAFSGQ